jgi:hypothetical protein
MKTIYVARKDSYARKLEQDYVRNGTGTG